MAISPTFRKTLMQLASLVLLFCCPALIGQEPRPNSDLIEKQALKVLNDSDWAHTVKPTLQDTDCNYRNPVFPGLFPEDKALIYDERSPLTPPTQVVPDTSEYLVRFQSAKPVQSAVQELLTLGDKWAAYGRGYPVSDEDGPTDLANGHYHIADMITVAVILKKTGRDGISLFNYGYQNNGRTFPSHSFNVFICSGLRTSNGQVFARAHPGPVPPDGIKALLLSFPRWVDGKLLITNPHEKVEFRMVASRRVFETSFYIDAADVLDGSEKTIYSPFAFTDLHEIAQQ